MKETVPLVIVITAPGTAAQSLFMVVERWTTSLRPPGSVTPAGADHANETLPVNGSMLMLLICGKMTFASFCAVVKWVGS